MQYCTVKNLNNGSVCYVVEVASSGKAWCFFFVFLSLRGLSSVVFVVPSPFF